MIRALCVSAAFALALLLTFVLADDGIVYLTHALAALAGSIAGACLVLVATANSGPCGDCPKPWRE